MGLGIGRVEAGLARGVEICTYSVRACETRWLFGGECFDLFELLQFSIGSDTVYSSQILPK